MKPIGLIHTPFPEKFGVPRQPGLVEEIEGWITLFPEFDQPGVFQGLEVASHIWVLFLFHHQSPDWSPRVRPPRLGGNERRGVFATRSPRRPNPIGLSAVRLLKVDHRLNQLTVSGIDVMDQTPVLDIKPYVPFSDCRTEATHGFAASPPPRLEVAFPPEVEATLSPRERLLITNLLSLDPRPAYHDDDRIYGNRVDCWNIKWTVKDRSLTVLEVTRVEAP